MLTPEDYTPEKFRIHWSAILVIFAVEMIVLIALSITVANHSSFVTASSAATKVGLSVVEDQSEGPMNTVKNSREAIDRLDRNDITEAIRCT